MTALPSTYRGPGLIDLQVNGYAGFDFNADPERWRPADWSGVVEAMSRRGVRAALPTLITDRPDRMIARAEAFGRIASADARLSSFFPGLHIEGPFISAEDGPRGAHPLAHCSEPARMPDLMGALMEVAGARILLVTLAPELPGAIDLIHTLRTAGIVVAIGHTAAGPDQLDAAVEAGARLSTHLGNGSHLLLPRLDNYVQRQLADDRMAASFIADGHHVPWPTLRNFLRAKTPDRSVLVTDAMAAADCGPGRYEFGGGEVVVSADLRCARPGATHLAGSALTLDRAILNVARFCGVPFETAWAMASEVPAALLGIPVPTPVAVSVSAEGFALLPD